MEFPEGITRFSVSSGSILTAAASLAASVMLLQSVTADLVPDALRAYFSTRLTKLSARLSSQLTLVIEESEGLTSNHMFEAANLFLGTKVSPATRRIKVIKPEKDEELIVTVDRNQEIVDFYDKVKMVWVLKSTAIQQQIGKGDRHGNSKTEQRYFELSFHNKYKGIVLRAYLPYILRKAKEIKEQSRAVRLHTVEYGGNWTSIVLNHPANFSTMAMPPEVKKEIIDDLDRFITRKDYYRRVGKAWKRGYLLYGPPGTGKSSLVAAMANYLNFDIYDLDLREIECNSDLRRLLIGSANRSILVIEDIDCNAVLHNRGSENQTAEDDKINLSGVLNLIDGLWSSCGDERIIVLTTNHKDRLDPALLRPGRMDVHIQMSYCTFTGFKVLASNYLRIEEHALYHKIEELLLKVKATPAEIAEQLMKNDDADIALGNLIIYLQNKENTHSSHPTPPKP